MPGDGSSIHEPSDHGGDTDSLHEGVSDCFLQLCCLLLGEVLVDVDDEPGVDLINKVIVSGEDFDVRVCNECRVALCHVLLNDCSSRHGVVDDFKVVGDGLGGDLLSKPLFDGLVRGVESDEDGPPDIVPSLLDCRVVDAVKVIGLYEDVSVGQLVGHPGPLSERNSDVLVHHGESTFLGDLRGGCLELDFPLGLFPTAVAVVLGLHLGGFFLELLLACFKEKFLIFCSHFHSPFTSKGLYPPRVLRVWILR